MAEDQGKKDEEQFGFTTEGEVLDYITLEQARVLAIEHARDNLDFYGSGYSRINLVWEVVSQEDGEDYYDIRLAFRPAGRYRGEPGIEQFIIDKVGSIRVRQLLDEPSEVGGQKTPAPTRRRRRIFRLALAAAAVVVVLFIIGVATQGDGQETSPGIITGPTATPVQNTVGVSTEIPTPSPLTKKLPTSPAVPVVEPIEAISLEELFGMSMVVMNGLSSFRVEVTLEERDPETQQITTTIIGGSKSGKTARYKIEEKEPSREAQLFIDAIWLPPYNYNFDPEEGTWYQEESDPQEPDGDAVLLAFSVLIFPLPDIPLEFYQLTDQGVEEIDGHPTRRMSVEVDWFGIADWLKSEGKLAAVAKRLSDERPEDFYDFYQEDIPDLVEVWIDENGFMRRFEFDGFETGMPTNGYILLYDFNLPLEILPPEQFFIRESVVIPPTEELLTGPPEELFSLSKAVMNDLDSFRFDASFDGQDSVFNDFGLSYFEATKSGDAAQYYFEPTTSEGPSTADETILLPPFVYQWDTDDFVWYRSRLGDGEPPGTGPAVIFSVLAFPHPDIPLDFYELEPMGLEFIDGILSRYIRVHVDWPGVANWFKAEGKLAESAARFTGDSPESFFEALSDKNPDSMELWIDEEGFLRKLEVQGGSIGRETVASFSFYEFNQPIEILPPEEFSVLEDAGGTGALVLPTPTPQIQSYQGLTFKQYAEPPLMTIDPTASYTATVHTNKGLIVLELFPDSAPITVNNFVFLTKEGFYDGLIFHRVIEQFMIQGGDPTGTGGSGPGYKFGDEIAPGLVFDKPGKIAMANSGPNTNGSQFFITTVPTPHLNGAHTIFGRVMKGQKVAEAISQVPKDQAGRPTQPVTIETIQIAKTGGR